MQTSTTLNQTTVMTEDDQDHIDEYFNNLEEEEYHNLEKKLVEQGEIQPENDVETPEDDPIQAEEDEKEHQRIQNMIYYQSQLYQPQVYQPPVNINYQPQKISQTQNKLCQWGDDCHGRLNKKCPYYHPNLKPSEPKSTNNRLYLVTNDEPQIKKCNFGDKCRKKGKGCPYKH